MKNFALKGVTLADFDNWLDAQLDNAGQPIDADTAKLRVPLLRRAQTKRAGAIKNVPFEILDGENDVSAKPRFGNLLELIGKAEMALCAYGAAYWGKIKNRGGFIWPTWYAPSTISLTMDGDEWTGFARNAGRVRVELPPEDVLYFWEQDEDVEVGPGQAPFDAALYAASALHNADKTLYNYFSRGAIRTTIFAVPQSTSEDEIKKLKSWWERIGQAVRNAYNTVFYRGGKLEPTVIGDPLSEIWNAALSADKREDISAALNVPVSMLLSNAANYATATEEKVQWYQDFVFPRCAWLADTINKQWLSAEGLEMVYHPELTEVWQAGQLAQVDKVTSAHAAGLIDVNEARQFLGMPEIELDAAPLPEPETETPEDELEDEPEKSLLWADIQKWERYAAKRYREGHPEKATAFKSDAISTSLQAAIRGALEVADTPQNVSEIFRNAALWGEYGFFPTV